MLDKIIYATITALLAGPATAEVKAQVIADACSIGPKENEMMCLSYIAGAMDGLIYGSTTTAIFLGADTNFDNMLAASKAVGICLPEPSNIGQNARVVSAPLDRHPEKWHLPAVRVVREALAEGFPCAGRF